VALLTNKENNMHSIKRQNENEWEVGYLQVCERGGPQVFIPLFRGLGCLSAIKLASSLNGGEANFDNLYAKILPNCAVKLK
jgi:hypothetical protein